MDNWLPELNNAKILIVDDEPANVLLLEKLLRSQGFCQVKSATDPRQAVALYRTERQDLVLLDMRMPHLNGLEVMALLQEVEAAIDGYLPVLVMTAQIDVSTRRNALQAGARDFVTKPFDPIEVLSRIRNLLEVRLLHNRLQQQKAHLEETVRARTGEIAATQLEVVRRLGRAAEYRDNETGLHIIRMSKVSAALARRKGLSPATCDLILNASPLHDIGKIGIPDAVLLKPGKLDAGEWAIMQTHPTIGGEILSGHDSDLIRMARTIALQHHEKWDGTGYPKGLAGEEIALSARITTIADVFDALTSVRPYKKAWPVADALQEIDRIAGQHLDPELVGLFHEILPEVLQIMAQHAEPDGLSHLHRISFPPP
ncbi:MAG TPA: HD domain-containing phosphohydrolase, partial [Rhodocyclaceae bacterium]|nr:HD domain-containing phosphohydrolase [Rhodocyclaceae bacterium]